MYRYSETLEFDLMVVLFVLVIMPLAVALMQSKKPIARTISFVLLAISFIYVGGFEHYRHVCHPFCFVLFCFWMILAAPERQCVPINKVRT